ncbi:TPA: hypothetical protein EYO57_14125 [Candidatus Poribacteria bacterium]|nr:hypothetical protein [Candidatus Poribacteria bacterium]
MIATKDHFLFIIKSTQATDELYAAEGYPAGNPIGFLAQGVAVTFKKEDIDAPWTKYSDTHHVAPNLHVRSIHSLFGAAAQTDNIVYVTVIPREGALEGEWEKLNNASAEESLQIGSSEFTFQVGEHCNIELCRDLDTFESIDPPEEALLNEEDITLNFE